MSADEFLSWREFFTLYPFDDFHRFHRPAALVSMGMGGGDVSARLEWLQPEPTAAPDAAGLSEVDKSILKAFAGTK